MRFLAGMIAGLWALFSVSSAVAETTVYTHSGNFAAWADPADPGNTAGVSDGASGQIPLGGWIAWQTDTTFTDVDFTLDFLGTTGTSTIRFYVGTSNGAGFFSNLQLVTLNVTTGLNRIQNAGLSSFCAGLGGCDVFIVQSLSTGNFVLDGADLTANFTAAATPEPGTWLLMILGFIAVALRLKAVYRVRRKQQPSFMGAPGLSPAAA
jgi:hypothetical protein